MTGAARIAFAGTPEFAVPTLRGLVQAGFNVPLVLTQPDRRSGRGRRLTPSPVKQAALELGLAVMQPAALNDETVLRAWGDAPELLVVVAYGLLLPQWVLDWPTVDCVNLHASLLPRWRGAAPVQRAILAGDERTGVSLMRVVARLDAGPVYATRDLQVRGTAGSLQAELADLGSALLLEKLPGILDGTLPAAPQNESLVTYADKLTKSEARLDWQRPAAELERAVRGLNPWPVAEGQLDDSRRLRIWAAELAPSGDPAAPGTITAATKAGIVVATGSGSLLLTRVQPPGARAMTVAEFLSAHTVEGHAFVAR